MARERPTQTPFGDFKYDNEILEAEFSKEPRLTQNTVSFRNQTYFFLEREFSNAAGVEERTPAGKSPPIRFTGVARTLIDSAVSPHYVDEDKLLELYRAGGAKTSVEELSEVYKQISLRYPYWQRVGYLLDLTTHKSLATEWLARFGKPRYRFYFTKGYDDSWQWNERWNLAYPPTLERD